jgi:hypothetical protein
MKSKLTMTILMGALALSAIAPSALAGNRSNAPRAGASAPLNKVQKAATMKTASHAVILPHTNLPNKKNKAL